MMCGFTHIEQIGGETTHQFARFALIKKTKRLTLQTIV